MLNEFKETREEFEKEFIDRAFWRMATSFLFRRCAYSNKLIVPFEIGYYGRATFFSKDGPKVETKWITQAEYNKK